MLIHLDRKSGEPLYAQIANYVRRLIETDMLKPGVKLPATRELAADLGVDRATIVAAYEELVAQGLATAHVGRGPSWPCMHPAQNQCLETAEPGGPAGEINWHQCFSRGPG